MTIRLELDRMVDAAAPHRATGAALERWYATHPKVLRLWAIEDQAAPGQTGKAGLRVVVMLAPTLDADETFPFWMAHGRRWTDELRRQVAPLARLELLDGPLPDAFDIDGDGVVVAALCWRESTSASAWS